jgi:hypothetical protein
LQLPPEIHRATGVERHRGRTDGVSKGHSAGRNGRSMPRRGVGHRGRNRERLSNVDGSPLVLTATAVASSGVRPVPLTATCCRVAVPVRRPG